MNKYIIKFVILIIVIFQSPLGYAKDFIAEVARANDLYAKNKYQEAADTYESIRKKGLINGYLYYNLGNTYIRLGKTGPAILNYIRAYNFIPRDENLQANLNYAIQQTQDKIPLPDQGKILTLFFWVNDLSLGELIKLTMIINLLFWLILIAWFYYRSNTFKLFRNLFLLVLFFSISSLFIKLEAQSNSITGVIMTKKVSVKSSHDLTNKTLFELHEGALVKVINKHKNWYEIRLNENQKGWVPMNSLGT